MTKKEAERQKKRQVLEKKRIAAAEARAGLGGDEILFGLVDMQRGGDEIKRGGDEIKRGGDEIKRGGDEIKRGGDEIKRGDGAFFNDGSSNFSQQVAMEIFGRAAALGGHLKVVFEAPIGASNRDVGPARSTVSPSIESDAAAIDEVVTDLIRRAKQRRTKAIPGPSLSVSQATARYASSKPQARKSASTRSRTAKSKA